MRGLKRYITISYFLLSSITALSQEKYTVSGHITNKNSGEGLIGTTVKVSIEGEILGAVSNVYGFYSITLPEGNHKLTFNYVGFSPVVEEISLTENIKINVELEESTTLSEVIVSADDPNAAIGSTEMSKERLDMTQIKKMPAFMGEVDVIKAIQMLPGVQTVGEGGSGFYVRGGGVDQNLVLLDEANVYNASHLMGFFSVFNPDVIKDVELYKGGIPAQYGGRLSSVLDIRMKEGNFKTFTMDGGLGTISSRLSFGAPIVKDKGSFVIAGRRTYADIFLKVAPNKDLRNNKLYFFDANFKSNYRINENNRIFLSGYYGRDVFEVTDRFRIDWGNATATARWNHVFTDKLFLNTTATFSNYDYFLGEPSGTEAYEWTSNIQDYYLKMDFTWYINPNHTLKYGGLTAYHVIDPGVATGVDVSILEEFRVPKTNALEHAFYASNTHKIGRRFTTTYGLRLSIFQNIGPGTYYTYDESYAVLDTIDVGKNEIYNTYWGLEPRLGMTYLLNESSSIKASYNRTMQYIHLASNSTASSPLDIWFPSSPNVKPQISDQVALGYFKNFKKGAYQSSVEVYYKYMQNAIDFKDHAELLLNPYLEGELRFGIAYAYGTEFMVKKTVGDFTGWVSYTLSRTRKQIEEINNGNPYFAKYDKTHDVSITLSYQLHPQWQISTNFVYSTGSAVTMPIGKYEYMGMLVPIYSDRNAKRLPDYHRLDFALTFKGKQKEGKRWHHEWVLSVYNVYNRANAYNINFKQSETNPNETVAEMMYLFGIIPSITYNFQF